MSVTNVAVYNNHGPTYDVADKIIHMCLKTMQTMCVCFVYYYLVEELLQLGPIQLPCNRIRPYPDSSSMAFIIISLNQYVQHSYAEYSAHIQKKKLK